MFHLYEKRRSPPSHTPCNVFYVWYTPINVALHIMMRDGIVSSGGPPTTTGTFLMCLTCRRFHTIIRGLGVGLNS